jgi:syntaxin 5
MPVAVGYATSSYTDRTSELHSVADSLRRSQAFSSQAASSAPNGTSSSSLYPIDGAPSASSRNQPYQQQQGPQSSGSVQSEFNKRASRIGLSIHQTSKKLAKLAKRKSIEHFLVFPSVCCHALGRKDI